MPGHSEFLASFSELFGDAGAAAMDPALVEAIEEVGHTPIEASEVERAATAMAAGKSTALG